MRSGPICILILAIMAILLFYAAGFIGYYQLNETIDGLTIPVGQGWELLFSLWPILLFMFFAGIFTVLIISKFFKPSESP